MSRPFDRVVVVDWSANATPKRGADSVWIGVRYADGRSLEPVNPATRAEATALLLDLLDAPQRTLVGFDFPLGYPAGFATAAGLEGPAPWAAAWTHLATAVVDGPRNANNRWEVAAGLNARLRANHFWGVPPRRSGPHLPRHKPPADGLRVAPFRLAEARLREHGLRPFPVWQLLGAGSVGSQSLTGIPVVHHLRHHPRLRERAQVWPFESGLRTPVADVVLAEVWPSAVPFDGERHPVKDARQVLALAGHLLAAQADGSLAGLFTPDVGDRTADVAGEEGWVLGVR